MKRNIFIVITVLLCFILQSTVFRWLAFGGIAPNLLVIITATFGFMCGQKCGLWVGFFSGLLYDIFFGNVLCFYQLHIAFPFAWQIPLPALSDACDSTGDHLYSFGNTDPVSADTYDQRKTGWNRKKERGRFCLNR